MKNYKAEYIAHRNQFRIYDPGKPYNTCAYIDKDEVRDYFTEEESCLLLRGQVISKEAVR